MFELLVGPIAPAKSVYFAGFFESIWSSSVYNNILSKKTAKYKGWADAICFATDGKLEDSLGKLGYDKVRARIT